jgi:integrase
MSNAQLGRFVDGNARAKARAKAGAPDAHFHDLRHTGGTLNATTGATTKELMAGSATQAPARR